MRKIQAHKENPTNPGMAFFIYSLKRSILNSRMDTFDRFYFQGDVIRVPEAIRNSNGELPIQ